MSEQCSTRAAADPFRAAPTAVHPLAVLAFASMLAATFAMPAGASDRWFTIEIIVFDDLRDEGLHAEHWPVDPGEPFVEDAVALTYGHGTGLDGAASEYRLVRPSEHSLNAVRNRLQRSAHYRPILHAGWRLRGLPRRAARPAHVGPDPGGSGAGAAAHVDDTRPRVHGTVTVSLARYLQVDVDLLYRRPAGDGAAVPDAAPTRFRLVATRRMRSRELHYVDHPLFGVLILLTPV